MEEPRLPDVRFITSPCCWPELGSQGKDCYMTDQAKLWRGVQKLWLDMVPVHPYSAEGQWLHSMQRVGRLETTTLEGFKAPFNKNTPLPLPRAQQQSKNNVNLKHQISKVLIPIKPQRQQLVPVLSICAGPARIAEASITQHNRT